MTILLYQIQKPDSISDDAIVVIASDVDGIPGKLEQLAAALEMSSHMPTITPSPNISSRTLLVRWKKEMEKLKVPLRAHLIHYLRSVGMDSTIHK